MKEIIGDDYPTYEDSVNMTLAERKKDSTYTYMKEIEQQITKDNLERLMQENFELKHRLACIADDIEIIDRHIQNNCNKRFKRPSLLEDGSTHADQAWHNITNIQIACDLNDDDVLEWTSDVKNNKEFKVKLKDTKSCIKDIEAELETLYVREPEEVEYIARVEKVLDEQYQILDKLIKNETN